MPDAPYHREDDTRVGRIVHLKRNEGEPCLAAMVIEDGERISLRIFAPGLIKAADHSGLPSKPSSPDDPWPHWHWLRLHVI